MCVLNEKLYLNGNYFPNNHIVPNIIEKHVQRVSRSILYFICALPFKLHLRNVVVGNILLAKIVMLTGNARALESNYIYHLVS